MHLNILGIAVESSVDAFEASVDALFPILAIMVMMAFTEAVTSHP